MQRVHTTLSGLEIEYDDPSEAVERFLAQVFALVESDKASANDLVKLVYGPENPIMAKHPFLPDKGWVTREVFDNPLYHVFADLIVQKQVAEAGVDPQSLGKPYTLSVAEAAERLGLSEAAVRKAVQDRRLPAWRHKGDRFYKLDPRTLVTFRAGTTGRREVGAPLKFKAGHDPKKKALLRIRTAPVTDKFKESPDDPESVGTTDVWRRAMVLTGLRGNLRAWWLVPSKESNKIETGDFFVSGKFEVTMKANNPKAAREAWEAFSRE